MGPNTIQLNQPLVLVGDFTVSASEEGGVIDAAKTRLEKGDWAAEGFPYFSGKGVFKRYEIGSGVHREDVHSLRTTDGERGGGIERQHSGSGAVATI